MDGTLTSVLYVSINDIQIIYVTMTVKSYHTLVSLLRFHRLHLLMSLNVGYVITLVFERFFTVRVDI